VSRAKVTRYGRYGLLLFALAQIGDRSHIHAQSDVSPVRFDTVATVPLCNDSNRLDAVSATDAAGAPASPNSVSAFALPSRPLSRGCSPAWWQASAVAGQVSPFSMAPTVSPPKRPAALPWLYASYAAVQALDAQSTLRALNAGAVEANPIMSGVAGNPAALLAVKGGVTAATIYLVEKSWKKNRIAGVVSMAVLTSAYAVVVANNYRVAAQ